MRLVRAGSLLTQSDALSAAQLRDAFQDSGDLHRIPRLTSTSRVPLGVQFVGDGLQGSSLGPQVRECGKQVATETYLLACHGHELGG